MGQVRYQIEETLSAEDFVDVLQRSTLAERRPVENLAQIEGMLKYADVIVTARADSLLVGVARSVSDFSYCTYLSDLAVDRAWQAQGIGTQLIQSTRQATGSSRLILLAAPAAREYYPRIGMEPHDSCWTFPPLGR